MSEKFSTEHIKTEGEEVKISPDSSLIIKKKINKHSFSLSNIKNKTK